MKKMLSWLAAAALAVPTAFGGAFSGTDTSGTAAEWDTLADAIAGAQAGSTITMNEDVTAPDSTTSFTKNLTFDGNGYTMTASGSKFVLEVANSMVVTITNLTVYAPNTLGETRVITVSYKGQLTLNDCNFTGYSCIQAAGGTSPCLTINSGTYISNGGYYVINGYNYTPSIVVNGGTFQGKLMRTGGSIAIKGGYFDNFEYSGYSSSSLTIDDNGAKFRAGTKSTDVPAALAALAPKQTVQGPDDDGYYWLGSGSGAETYNVTVASPNATVTIGGTEVASGDVFEATEGLVYAIVATPASGYQNPVIDFEGETITSGDTYSFTSDGTLTVECSKIPPTATGTKDGEAYEWTDLATALSEADEGTTLTICKDVTVSAQLSIAKSLTIVGTGMTLTDTSGSDCALEAVAGKTINITGLTLVATQGARAMYIRSGAVVTLTDCNYTTYYGIDDWGGTVTISGGSFTATSNDFIYRHQGKAYTTINGGTFGNGAFKLTGSSASSYGTYTINGGTFNNFSHVNMTSSNTTIANDGATFKNQTGVQTVLEGLIQADQKVVDLGDDYLQVQSALGPTTTYTITVTAPNATVKVDGEAVSGSFEATAETAYTITAEADSGYDMTGMTIDGAAFESGDQYTFTKDCAIVVTTTPSVETYDIAISVENATLTIAGTPYASGSVFVATEGETYALVATAADGYVDPVIDFNGETIASGTEYEFTEAGTLSVTATPAPTPTPEVPAKGDVDGNKISDVMIQYVGDNRQIGYWMNGTSEWQGTYEAQTEDWTLLASADLNADGKADAVMSFDGTMGDEKGIFIGYYSAGDTSSNGWKTVGCLSNPDDAAWDLAIGNISGNESKNSLVWHSSELAELGVWLDGTNEWTEIGYGCDDKWALQGCGDFGGTTADEVLMMYDGVLLYYVDANNEFTELGTIGPAWTVAAIGDFTGDGIDDIVMYCSEFGLIALLEDGLAENFTNLGQIDAEDWIVIGAGDYNGDDIDDLLMRQVSTGTLGYFKSGDLTKWVEIGNGLSTTDWKVVP